LLLEAEKDAMSSCRVFGSLKKLMHVPQGLKPPFI
jgi:hypothetical protein